MSKISKWEIGGVPAALVFEALYGLGVFERMGLRPEDTPHVMVVAFVLFALIRGATSRKD